MNESKLKLRTKEIDLRIMRAVGALFHRLSGLTIGSRLIESGTLKIEAISTCPHCSFYLNCYFFSHHKDPKSFLLIFLHQNPGHPLPPGEGC